MKLSELTQRVSAIEARIAKAQTEIVAEIQSLRESLNDVEIPAEAEASLSRLETLAASLDEMNADAPAAGGGNDQPTNPPSA